jgi:bis(5'-nucleosyl)-tetraphosphatase (symmetrical)
LLRSLGAGGVLGNHDVHLLRVAAGRRRPGRRDTFRDVLSAPDRDELLAWLAERPFVKSFDDVILVHAALNPTWSDPVGQLSGIDPLAWSDDSDFALRARYCTPSGERPRRDHPDPGLPFVPWYEHWAGRDSRTVVFGHWAVRGLIERPGLRGLDTGCVWGGRLTAWIAEEDRLISVRAARMYADPLGDVG